MLDEIGAVLRELSLEVFGDLQEQYREQWIVRLTRATTMEERQKTIAEAMDDVCTILQRRGIEGKDLEVVADIIVGRIVELSGKRMTAGSLGESIAEAAARVLDEKCPQPMIERAIADCLADAASPVLLGATVQRIRVQFDGYLQQRAPDGPKASPEQWKRLSEAIVAEILRRAITRMPTGGGKHYQ